ncbi:SAGA-associated factor 29 like protein [Aduncisulcus paluster]|uniref:SAGA-associated factor 29 like protein n=1 Tax=Aduncisulcus paluster TaxID=2918883 RepID=A0ABQ5JQM0_9EUKA|nr:SAGA-associated factor 29 like protein [Aduncisulcus paluster]
MQLCENMSRVSISQGKSVAARIWNEGGYNWIVATVIDVLDDGKQYKVSDIFSPEAESTVSGENIIAFPQKYDSFKHGEIVLALWYDSSGNEWTTMFYPAIVLGNYDSTSKILKLRYAGDPSIWFVQRNRIIKVPKIPK